MTLPSLPHSLRAALFAVLCSGLSVHAATITSLVGDKDQNPPPNPDGHGIVHEAEDLPGFDQRLVGGNYSWTHTFAPSAGASATAAVIDIAVVGFIDGNYPGINNRLYFNGNEVAGAFDNSLDGWNLYTFNVPLAFVSSGSLLVTVDVSSLEGWGGVDFSELRLTVPGGNSVPDTAATGLLAGLALAGLALARRRR